jgi:lipopolysaccharide transport system ATP-binding protein
VDDVAIAVRAVSKRYRVFESERARLLHAIWPKPRPGTQDIWALRDVSFEVKRGESVAVIGRNGGGKSTLLQILSGTVTPSGGDVRVNGRVSALLELGSGFNPEYTGRDNVILNGILLGLTREEILRRFDEIASFADIGDALDRAVKTYSSGMVMRLAFAVLALTDPEILIIDEALSVGDFFFQQKCFRYIRTLRERGVTLLFVSHDMGSVRDLCTTGLFLKRGRVDYFGDNLEAIRRYLQKEERDAPAATAGGATENAPPASLSIEQPLWKADEAHRPIGSKGRILAVGVFDASGRPTPGARMGDDIVVRVLFRSHCEEPLHVSAALKNKHDQIVTVAGSYTLQIPPPRLKRDQEAFFELTLRALLEAGDYSLCVSLAQPTAIGAGNLVDETPWLGPLKVRWDYETQIPAFYGMVGLASAARYVLAGDVADVAGPAP